MKKIDWDKIWQKYYSWWLKAPATTQVDNFEKIQSLVEAQLKVKRKK